MPRPPVNINASLSGTFGVFRRRIGADWAVYNGQQTGVFKRRVLQTPQGINNPLDEWGWRNPSPWSVIHQEATPSPPGFFRAVTFDGSVEVIYQDCAWIGVSAPLIDPPPASLRGRAINEALSELKQVGGQVNLATNMYERKQAVDLFTSTLSTIAEGFLSLRRRKKQFLKRLLLAKKGDRRFAGYLDSYLQYMYGVSPLISDVHDAVKARELAIKGRAPAVSVVGKATLREESTREIQSATSGGIGWFTVSTSDIHHVKVRLDYCLKNPFIGALASLGLTNLPSLVWEELPFSFVIDWAVNVGSFLELMDADYGWEFKAGSVSSISKRVERSYFHSRPNGSWSASTWTGSNYSNTCERFSREVLGSTPLPWFGLKNPFPKNSVHINEAIALLVRAFR